MKHLLKDEDKVNYQFACDDDEIIVCYSCNYPAPTTAYRDRTTGGLMKNMRFCTLCFTSLAGNACRYPNQYPNSETMHQSTFNANAILDQMGAFDYATKLTITHIED